VADVKRKAPPIQLPTKEQIREQAAKGFFDRNPLLSAPHEVTCKDCRCRNRVVFLEYLGSGQFEVGETKMLEVTYATPSFTGLGRTIERSTPLVFKIECRRCGTEIPHSPVSLEYLLFTTERRETSEIYI